MLEMLVNNSTNMQNVYTPLPFNFHLCFCLVATLLYLVQFYRKRSVYYLLIMIAVDLTFVTQYWTSKPVICGLAVAEIALIVSAVSASHFHNKKIRAMNAEKNAQIKQELEDKKQAEKSEAENDKKIVDNAFEDVDE